MTPDDLSKILARHDSFVYTGEPYNALDTRDIHNDRGALIEEVERLQSNFEQVIYQLDDFLNHNARIMESEQATRIRGIANSARGLR